MSVPAPKKPKPFDIDEITRTLRIYDLIVDGLRERMDQPRGYTVTDEQAAAQLLLVAQSIAARTEGMESGG